MYEFRSILLEDQDRINHIRQESQLNISTFSFPVLYLWQEMLQYTIHLEDDFFLIRIGHKSEGQYMFPVGNPQKQRRFLRECLKRITLGYPVRLSFIPSGALRAFDECGLSGMVQEDRNHFDYIGSIPEYLAMEGQKYRHIRKALRRFEKEHTLLAEPITLANLGRVRDIALAWEEERRSACPASETDTFALLQAIDAYDQLPLHGSLFLADGAYVGFLIASELSSDTVDIHFAKNTIRDLGLDYATKQRYFEGSAGQYTYYNMEEDLGITGIRNHKLLLNPVSLQPVYRLNTEGHYEVQREILRSQGL